MLATLHLQYPQSLPWVVLLILGLSAVTLLVYPAQLRNAPRAWWWLPPTLRILAISVISLSILRPAIIRTRVASERAPIAILIDNSRSMSAVDMNRSPGEWMGIAAAMGRLSAEARDKRAVEFQADCDRLYAKVDDVSRARAEVGYATLSGRGMDAARSRLEKVIDDFQQTARDVRRKLTGLPPSKQLVQNLAFLVQIPVGIDHERWLNEISKRALGVARDAETARLDAEKQLYTSDERIRDACLPLQSMSRLQLSEAAVFDPDHGFLTRLGSETAVRLSGISDAVTVLARKEPSLQAEGSTTNLNGQIRLVLESLKAAPPRALVLISDGRQVMESTDPATMSAIQGIPIFTVGVAPLHGSVQDISIVSANVTATAIVGERILFDATLRARGMPKDTVTQVTFTGGGQEQIQEVHLPDDRPLNVALKAVMSVPGMQKLTLDVVGVTGEASLDNNHVERWVNVIAATTRPVGKPATRPSREAEMVDLSGDESSLIRLSNASGGQFFRLDQIDLLPARLAELRDDVNHPIEAPLWDRPLLFVFVLGCLTAEWSLRKRWGLT